MLFLKRRRVACQFVRVADGERSLLPAVQSSVKGIHRQQFEQCPYVFFLARLNQGRQRLWKDLRWCCVCLLVNLLGCSFQRVLSGKDYEQPSQEISSIILHCSFPSLCPYIFVRIIAREKACVNVETCFDWRNTGALKLYLSLSRICLKGIPHE